MTHSPPLPAGNQSPYPIQELPLAERIVAQNEGKTEQADDRAVRLWAGLAAMAGLGVIGLAYRKYRR